MRIHSFAILVTWLLRAASVPAQGGYPQPADRYVNDFAGLLSDAQAAEIRSRFSDLNTSHGVEAVVVTMRSMNDYRTGRSGFESFATGLFNTWGIGERTRNDGALLLVGLEDRKARIELGAAYGHRLDNRMKAIIDRELLPRFRARQFGEGIVAASRSLAGVLEAESAPRSKDSLSPPSGTGSPASVGTGLAGSASPVETSVNSVAEPSATPAPLLAEAVPSKAPPAAGPDRPNAEANPAAENRSASRPAAGQVDPLSPRPVGGGGHVPIPVSRPTVIYPARGPSLRILALFPMIVMGVLIAGLLGVGLAMAGRMRSRKCPSCQTEMALLDEATDDIHLDSGQRLEEYLGSINYAVYQCPQCGTHSIEPQRRWFSSYSDCPHCGRRTLETNRQTLSYATTVCAGRQLVMRHCRNCNHHDEDTVILPRLPEPQSSGFHDHRHHGIGPFSGGGGSSFGGGSSSSSSRRDSGGSSHFGGGRSGGGGASGSW